MAFISNGTTVATGGSLQNVPAPSNSQILTGVASASVGATGSYAMCWVHNSTYTKSPGQTIAGSSLRYSNVTAVTGGTPGGTWRCVGNANGSSNAPNYITAWLRIS